MTEQDPAESAAKALREMGVPAVTGCLDTQFDAFPIALQGDHGQEVTVGLKAPLGLSQLDRQQIGVALVDSLGYVRKSWGLAETSPLLSPIECLLENELTEIIQKALMGKSADHRAGSQRFIAVPYSVPPLASVLILVLNAEEERQALAKVELADRMVRMLSRVGIALSMNQNLEPLCTEAVHQIASSSELAAVLLWTKDPDSELLTLMASVGVNRQGIGVVQTLSPEVGSTCVAEIAAATRQPIHLRSVQSSIMTSELEAKFCYLRPGGVSVVPLVIGDKLVGVLELVGKDGDLTFGESQSLFRTVAEQLALALNSAMLFESLERLATFDPLTGIANHRAMQEFLHQRLAEAKRMGTEVAVLMIDVDHFRSFNEDEGHDAGDDVLRKVAEILSMAVRPYDLAARYGGEEFTIIMPDIHAEAALAVAERIRQRVEHTTCTFKSGRSRSITASVGCAMFPHAASEPGDVLKAADVALFHAKAMGRNRVVMYSPEMNQPEHGLQRLDTSSWILPELLTESLTLQSEVESRLPGLAERLQLGINQQQMLLNLAALAPTYLFAVRHGLGSVIDEMHTAAELRPLLPAFSGLTARFQDEEKGQRIPLLARIILVIRAMSTGEGLEDEGLLDPELVEIIDRLPRAA